MIFVSLISSLLLIFISLTLGYCYRKRVLKKSAATHTDLGEFRNRLQFVAFFILIPLSSLLSLWGMKTPTPKLFFYPLLGVAAWTIGGMTALLLAKLFRFSKPAAGSLFCCGTFSNIGAVGTLVCVLFFGEASIAYVALYRLCEELIYYGLALPVAAKFRQNSSKALTIQGFRIGKLLIMILCCLALGIILQKLHVPRPVFFQYCASVMSITAAVLALFSIGLGLRLSKIVSYKKASVLICFIKFLLVPICITALALLLGFGSGDAYALKVALVCASMPVAMNALIPPALFSLDLDLANACWLVSTGVLLFVLPILSFFVLPAFA